MAIDKALAYELRQWIAKAEEDMTAARHLLRLGRECPTMVVCFHAQQCVEKYLKTLLAANGQTFPRTHDIDRLVALLPAGLTSTLSAAEQDTLTDDAVVARYPSSDPPVTLTEARTQVRVAARERSHIRKQLPPSVLRRRK